MSALPILRASSWGRFDRLEHGFLGRRGGTGDHGGASLNLSYAVGDSAAAVDDNWGQVRANVCALAFATMKQVHGSRVVEVTEPGPVGEADAMVTSTAGLALGVLTADCVPILIVAPGAHVVAAVHAGWRGTLAGVATEALKAVVGTYAVRAGDVHVALGPAIGRCCFEVDAGIVDAFERRWMSIPEAVERYDRSGCAKAKLDLRRANARMLAEVGVMPQRIAFVGGCTFCRSEEFFSHRAASKAGGVVGRQLSFIGWSA